MFIADFIPSLLFALENVLCLNLYNLFLCCQACWLFLILAFPCPVIDKYLMYFLKLKKNFKACSLR